MRSKLGGILQRLFPNRLIAGLPFRFKDGPDEIVFKISGEQYQQFAQWQQVINARELEIQLQTGRTSKGIELDEEWLTVQKKLSEHGQAIPWYSSIQGVYVFRFHPSAEGTNITVENSTTGDKIDLYEKTADDLDALEKDDTEKIVFRVSGAQYQKLAKWRREGDCVFLFCPTTLGLIVKVENATTGGSIDLSDYDDW